MKTLNSLQFRSNRRDFLKSIAVLSAVYGLPFSLQSCQSESTSSNTANYFDVLRQVRKGLQQSPDFLPKRAEGAIASKNVEQIFRFVRDAIQTLPNSTGTILPNKNENKKIRQWNYRWGIEGCLRYGAGTFYEKAALLEDMLKKAGFSAKLKKGDFDIEKVGWNKVFFRSNDITFDPDIPNKLLKMKFKGRQYNEKLVQNATLEDERLESTLEEMIALLPDDFVFPNPDWKQLTQEIFEVELTEETEAGSKTQMFNPNITDASVGKSYISGKPKNSSYKEEKYTVEVKLQLGNSANPYHPTEFIKGKIPLSLLFKNQLMLNFQHSMDIKTALIAERRHIKMLTPTISLLGENLTEEEQKQYTFTGKTIHLNGDTIEVKDDKVFVNEVEIGGENQTEHPKLRQQVQTLEMDIDSHAFPLIQLNFNPLDTNGKVVEGLGTMDFVTLENDKAVDIQVTKRQKSPPKVLLVFDLSTSVPEIFREEGAVEFGDKLVKEIQSKVPDAQFKTAWYNWYNFHPIGEWDSDSDKVQNSLKKLKGKRDSHSYLWRALLNANSRQEADVVIFVTDGKALDQLDLHQKSKLQLGCPTVVIGVGEEQDAATLEEMASLTNGIFKTAEQHEEAIAHICQFLDKSLEKVYSLQYRSLPQGKEEHTVKLEVKDTQVVASGKYPIPASSNVILPGWTGIYLEINYYSTSAKRCLAGLNLYTSEKWNPLQARHLEDTEAALFGHYKIQLEGQPPTTSVLLDELIGAKLTQEKFYESFSNPDANETFEALEEGFLTYPEHYPFMQSDFNSSNKVGKDYLTYSDGICATIYGVRPRAEDGRVIQTLDILPLSQWRTLHQDPKKGFLQTMRHSLRLMNLEAKNFPHSTMNLLDGRALEQKNGKELKEWLRKIGNEDNLTLWRNWKRATSNALGWHNKQAYFFLPKDKSHLAYYTLDGNSGTVMALMDNANGAGVEETNDMYRRLDQALTALGIAANALNLSAFGIWIQLEKEKLKWIQMATIAIITMQSPGDEEVRRQLINSICNMVAAGGAMSNAESLLNDLLSLTGHRHIEGCGVSG